MGNGQTSIHWSNWIWSDLQPKKDDARRQFCKASKQWTFFFHCQLDWKFSDWIRNEKCGCVNCKRNLVFWSENYLLFVSITWTANRTKKEVIQILNKSHTIPLWNRLFLFLSAFFSLSLSHIFSILFLSSFHWFRSQIWLKPQLTYSWHNPKFGSIWSVSCELCCQ